MPAKVKKAPRKKKAVKKKIGKKLLKKAKKLVKAKVVKKLAKKVAPAPAPVENLPVMLGPVPASTHPTTLAIDIGGTGLKMMLLDKNGKQLSRRLRVETPVISTPERVLKLLDGMAKQVGGFDRASVGFPGVVRSGVTLSAANVSKQWMHFPLEARLKKLWRKPVRVGNDADVQGYGAIKGKGLELVVTVGTGVGAALFTNGHLCPGLELGHHPWKNNLSYEQILGKKGYKRIGRKRWNEMLKLAIAQWNHTFNYDHLYLGGGNAKKISFKLPANVTVVPNVEGLFGGVALWRHDN